MKKLRLDLEELAVESFDTGKGGVVGHDTTTDCSVQGAACTYDCEDSAGETACGPCPTHEKTQCHRATCDATCQETCEAYSNCAPWTICYPTNCTL